MRILPVYHTMSSREVAARTGFTMAYIAQQAKKGNLAGRKIGTWQFTVEQVKEFLKNRSDVGIYREILFIDDAEYDCASGYSRQHAELWEARKTGSSLVMSD